MPTRDKEAEMQAFGGGGSSKKAPPKKAEWQGTARQPRKITNLKLARTTMRAGRTGPSAAAHEAARKSIENYQRTLKKK